MLAAEPLSACAVARLRAVLLDVDGTLYDQRRLRARLLPRLLLHGLRRPITGWRTAAAIRAYRDAQEQLRSAAPAPALAERQLALAGARCDLAPDVVRALVARWMEREPLSLLGACARPGLAAFLAEARARGLRIAVVSDYPAAGKLAALGISELVDVVVCAQDADVACFKPDPRGLLVALARLGAAVGEAVYVGDRATVDAAAARAAGMRCLLVGDRAAADAAGVPHVPDFGALARVLLAPVHPA